MYLQNSFYYLHNRKLYFRITFPYSITQISSPQTFTLSAQNHLYFLFLLFFVCNSQLLSTQSLSVSLLFSVLLYRDPLYSIFTFSLIYSSSYPLQRDNYSVCHSESSDILSVQFSIMCLYLSASQTPIFYLLHSTAPCENNSISL